MLRDRNRNIFEITKQWLITSTARFPTLCRNSPTVRPGFWGSRSWCTSPAGRRYQFSSICKCPSKKMALKDLQTGSRRIFQVESICCTLLRAHCRDGQSWSKQSCRHGVAATSNGTTNNGLLGIGIVETKKNANLQLLGTLWSPTKNRHHREGCPIARHLRQTAQVAEAKAWLSAWKKEQLRSDVYKLGVKWDGFKSQTCGTKIKMNTFI
jgi:hypothetical protein